MIKYCKFSGITDGSMCINGTNNMIVEFCDIDGGIVGVQFWQTSGSISNCTINGISNVCIALEEASATVSNNVLCASGIPLSVTGWSSALFTNNIIPGGGTYQTMELTSSTVTMRGNHILHGPHGTIILQGYVHDDPIQHLDFSNNYWGTTSADSIASWIWDGGDNPFIRCIIEYEPFSTVPISVEKKSWGGVKSLFR